MTEACSRVEQMASEVVRRVHRQLKDLKTKDTYWRIHPRFLTKLPGPKAVIPQDLRDIIERGAQA